MIVWHKISMEISVDINTETLENTDKITKLRVSGHLNPRPLWTSVHLSPKTYLPISNFWTAIQKFKLFIIFDIFNFIHFFFLLF